MNERMNKFEWDFIFIGVFIGVIMGDGKFP